MHTVGILVIEDALGTIVIVGTLGIVITVSTMVILGTVGTSQHDHCGYCHDHYWHCEHGSLCGHCNH